MESERRVQLEKIGKFRKASESGFRTLNEKTRELEEMKQKYLGLEDELIMLRHKIRTGKSDDEFVRREKYEKMEAEFIQVKR